MCFHIWQQNPLVKPWAVVNTVHTAALALIRISDWLDPQIKWHSYRAGLLAVEADTQTHTYTHAHTLTLCCSALLSSVAFTLLLSCCLKCDSCPVFIDEPMQPFSQFPQHDWPTKTTTHACVFLCVYGGTVMNNCVTRSLELCFPHTLKHTASLSSLAKIVDLLKLALCCA